ncbi:putative thioredoxin-disulfide reductase [Helianthus debilis subsp. tardiflorus]
MAVQVPKSKPLTIKPSYSYPAEKMAIVTRLVKDRAVVIFSKSSCCICHSIKTLICSFGANPTVYELDERPDGQQIEKELIALGCTPCVPAVFIGQELVGGSNEIMSLHLKGKLVPMLIKERAIWL